MENFGQSNTALILSMSVTNTPPRKRKMIVTILHLSVKADLLRLFHVATSFFLAYLEETGL